MMSILEWIKKRIKPPIQKMGKPKALNKNSKEKEAKTITII